MIIIQIPIIDCGPSLVSTITKHGEGTATDREKKVAEVYNKHLQAAAHEIVDLFNQGGVVTTGPNAVKNLPDAIRAFNASSKRTS